MTDLQSTPNAIDDATVPTVTKSYLCPECGYYPDTPNHEFGCRRIDARGNR